jgi:hypothetical protein
MQVSVMCQTAPRKIASPDPVNEPGRAVPSSDDIANDPLWQDVKRCWHILMRRDRRSLESLRFQEGYDLNIPAHLVHAHEEVLKTLIKLKQLEPEVAEGVRRAFTETATHLENSMMSCYWSSPPERPRHVDLLLQLQTLREMTERCEIQPEILERVRGSIARNIGLFGQTRFTEPSEWKSDILSFKCKEGEAARVIVALLLNSHNPT